MCGQEYSKDLAAFLEKMHQDLLQQKQQLEKYLTMDSGELLKNTDLFTLLDAIAGELVKSEAKIISLWQYQSQNTDPQKFLPPAVPTRTSSVRLQEALREEVIGM